MTPLALASRVNRTELEGDAREIPLMIQVDCSRRLELQVKPAREYRRGCRVTGVFGRIDQVRNRLRLTLATSLLAIVRFDFVVPRERGHVLVRSSKDEQS